MKNFQSRSKRKKKRKAIIIISCVVASVLIFFISALIYSAVNKNKDEEGGGIVLSGDERGYDNNVILGKYRGIEYVPLEVNVTDEELVEYIENMLEENPNFEVDYSRDNTPVEDGDEVLIVYTLTVNNINYCTDESMVYVCGDNYFGESFDSVLRETIIGDFAEKDAEVTVPEDFGIDSIDGQTGEVRFYVESSVKVYDYLTDDYCNNASGGQYKTVDEYQNYCRDILERAEQSMADEKKWNDIWKALRDSCELTIDERSVEQEYQDMIDYYQSYASYLGTTMEELVTAAYGYTTVQDFYDYCRDYSRTVVEERVIYGAIIKKENITIDDETYLKMLGQYMEEAGYSNMGDFEEMVGKEQIIQMMKNDMVSELLLSSAVAVEK